MTDRFKGLTVVFGRDIREDDAKGIINAIKMIKGVADVVPSVASSGDEVNRVRVENELREEIYELFQRRLHRGDR